MHIPVAMCVGDTLHGLRRSLAEGYGGRYALNGEDLKLLPGFFALCLFLVALLLLLLSLRFALCNLPLEVPNKEAGKGARDAEGENEGPKGLPDAGKRVDRISAADFQKFYEKLIQMPVDQIEDRFGVNQEYSKGVLLPFDGNMSPI